MISWRRALRRALPTCALGVLFLVLPTPALAFPGAAGAPAKKADEAAGSASSDDRLRRGMEAYHAQRFSEAVEAWKPLASLPGADAALLYRYFYALRESGGSDSEVAREQKRARKALEAAVKGGGGPVECYYLAVLMEEKEEEKASRVRRDCFDRLQDEAGSADPERVYFLGRLVLSDTGYEERAEKLLRRAMELYRELPEESRFFLDNVVDDLGDLLRQADRASEALDLYNRGLEEFPGDGRLLAGRAATFQDLQRMAESERDWREYLKGDPSDGGAWTSFGLVLWSQDKNQEALEAFRTAEEKGFKAPSRDNGVGLSYRDLGKPAEAAAAFRRAIAADPDWPVAHYNLAGVLLGQGDAAGAEKESLAAIRLEPTEWDFYARLAEVRKKSGNREGALQAYRDAAAAKASPERAYAFMGNLLVEDGRAAEGLSALQKAMELSPKDGLLKKDLGQALENLKRYPEAEAAYRESITLAPDSAVPHGYLGSLLETTGRKDEALKEYEAAEKLDPEYAYAVERTFLILVEGKGPAAALEYLEPRLARFPKNVSLMRRAAIAHDDLKQLDPAEKLLRGAIQVDPKYDLGYDSRALVLEEGNGRKAEALEVLREGLRQVPDSAILEFRIATFLDNRNLPAEAEPHLRKSLELNPNLATAWNSLGAILDHLGRTSDAIPCFEKAIALRPGFTLAELNLARLYRKLGRHDDAVAGFRKIFDSDPGNADAGTLLADELRQAGKLDEAGAAASRVLERSPANPAAMNVLGDVALARGDQDEALKIFARAQEAATTNDYPFRKAAEILDRRGDYVEELDLLERFRARFPQAAYPVRQQGVVLNRTGRYDRALEAFKKAADLDPEDWVAWAGMGDANFNAGRFEAAQEAYAKAVTLSKGSPAPLAALASTLVKLNRGEEAIAAYRKLLSQRESAADRISLAQILRAAGRVEEAESVLVQGLEKAKKQEAAKETQASDAQSLRRALADLYEAAGRPTKAEPVLREVVQESPDDLPARRSLSRALRAQGKLEEAALQLEAVLERDPDDPEAVAMLKSFPKEVADAAAFLKKIRPQPLDFDPVDTAGALSRYRPEDPEIAPLLRDKSLVVLEDHLQIDVRPGGLLTQTYHQVLRAQDKATADALGEYRIHYVPAREQLEVHLARTHLPDGSSVDAAPEAFHKVSPADTSTGNLYSDEMILVISLPQVQPNAEIEIIYTRKMKSTLTDQNWWATWAFQTSSPSLRSRLAVRIPSGTKIFHDSRGAVPEPEIHESGDHRIYLWTMKNIPAVPDEPGGLPLSSRRAEMSITSYASWNDVASWFHDLIKNQYDLDPEARAATAGLLQGAASPLEKARRIYDRLQETVRYVGVELGISSYQPHAASLTYGNRYGDCKDRGVLLIAMLKEAGVRALPALIRTRSKGPVAKGAPSPGQFDHFIVFAPDLPGPAGSPGLWLDATAEHSEIGTVPSMDQGVEALVLDGGKADFRRVPASGPADNHRILKRQVEILPDGTARVTDDAVAHGYFAERFREVLSGYDEKGRKDLVDQSVTEEFPGATKIDFAFTGMALSGDPPRDLEHYEVARFVKSVGKSWTVSLGVLDSIGSTLPTSPAADRSGDFEADVPMTLEELTEVRLPEGRAFTDWPEPVRLEGAQASYQLDFTKEGRALRIHAVFVLKDRRVPLAAYAEFVSLVQRAIEAGRVTLLAR